MSIFKKYDIRGIIDEHLTEDVIQNIGRAIGSELQGTIIIGRDNRIHGKKVRDLFIKSVLSTGCNVIEIGVVTTPILYFCSKIYPNTGAVMITASHNPKQYNGFKIIKDSKPFFGDDIQKLKQIIDNQNFKTGQGKIIFKTPVKKYMEDLLNRTQLTKKIKVVVDCGNGTPSFIVTEILEKLGCDVIKLYCKSDGNFPNHEPDPVVEENLKDLIKTVKETKADLGMAFDGDGDRLGIVDENGTIIPGDKILLILARDLLKQKPNSKIIYDIKCSMILKNDIEKHDGIPIMYKTGHSFVKKKMKKEDADLAGELSGHFFFKELGFFDDALYAACKVLKILADSNKKMSELLNDIPKTYVTPEIKYPCSENIKFNIITELQKRFAKYNPLTIDGVRIEFEDGWGLVRASNTEPVLILRFEAKDPNRLNEIKKLIETEVQNVKNNTPD